MSLFDRSPLHDFPDRAIRDRLADPRNLRDLLTACMPDLASHFDFERAEIVPPEFLLDDWRRRKADLLFRIPFAASTPGEEAEWVLVCLLLEHHTVPDPQAPLRTLLYAVLYWETEWKAWAFWRRPAQERSGLVEAAQESQTRVAHREEIRRMSETIERTWPEELVAQGVAEGELRARREDLRMLLEKRFGALPEAVAQRIEQSSDVERLREAILQVYDMQDLSELHL